METEILTPNQEQSSVEEKPSVVEEQTVQAAEAPVLSTDLSDEYIVQEDDTLLSIANRFGVSYGSLIVKNNIDRQDVSRKVHGGARLVIR